MKCNVVFISIMLLFGFVNFVINTAAYYIDASSGNDTRSDLSTINTWNTLDKAELDDLHSKTHM